jgi:hypothetical protein
MLVAIVQQRSFRSRLVASLSLALLLLALAGGGAYGAAPAVRVSLAPHAIPASSCHGLTACYNVTGTIGEHSCNGALACYNANGDVGNGSCDGDFVCSNLVGTVGNNACDGGSACSSAQANVGNRSCTTAGSAVCANLHGDVGTGSCNRDPSNSPVWGCFQATGPIGNYACNGAELCDNAGAVADCVNNSAGFVPAPCLATRSVMGSTARSATAAQPVMLWATVAARYPVIGTPTGTFQFRLDGQALGSPVAINAHGRAHVTLYLRPGIHWITGRYGGDGTFAASVPVRLYQFVKP